MRAIWALAGVLVVLGACGSEARSNTTAEATGVSTAVTATPTTSAVVSAERALDQPASSVTTQAGGGPEHSGALSLDTQLSLVEQTTDPGVVRARLTLATLVSAAMNAQSDPLVSIGITGTGLIVGVPPGTSIEATRERVRTAVSQVIAEHPELDGYGDLTVQEREPVTASVGTGG